MIGFRRVAFRSRAEVAEDLVLAKLRCGPLVADPVARGARITGVREWPLDASTLLRWALYLALGLGSWLGGALVERLPELALR